MAQNYFSIVTNIGRNKLALSAAGGAAVTITHFAIGDGNGAEVNPTSASTALVREVWRTPVESVVIDPLNPSAVLVTSIIPTNAGGWWMREFGIFDVDGDMVAVAKPVSQYKPTALEGQLEDIRYEFQIIIGETANVTMLVDPSVLLASRDFVEKRKVPFAQLSLTPWVPVKSVTVTVPPANPAAWDTYVIPNGATGAWAGQAQKLAEWNGAAWKITTPPDGHGVSTPDGYVYMRLGGVYVRWYATGDEAAGGVIENKVITPPALAAVLRMRFGDQQHRIVSSSNPVFPEVLNATGKLTISVSGLSVSVSTGQSWMHRGVYRYSSDDYSSAQRTFAVANNKEYHLRWTPSNGFALKDLSDVTYNPTATQSYNAIFDTLYDDMLCASVSVTGGVATVTSLVNKAELRGRATLAGAANILTTGNGNDGIRYRAQWLLQWSRVEGQWLRQQSRSHHHSSAQERGLRTSGGRSHASALYGRVR
ncbi:MULTISPECIES: phage tail protein, partial [unclassified Brucella]|uniref:phage tail protein n=1 Tax=unclassified Brucella TaxID=2632610 RepID=UPI0012ADF975